MLLKLFMVKNFCAFSAPKLQLWEGKWVSSSYFGHILKRLFAGRANFGSALTDTLGAEQIFALLAHLWLKYHLVANRACKILRVGWRLWNRVIWIQVRVLKLVRSKGSVERFWSLLFPKCIIIQGVWAQVWARNKVHGGPVESCAFLTFCFKI